ncbi:NDUFAF2 [Branchiostoma lanceolatum]|uniref:NDUFAF2 protein n=1 Tax=Branchiostoma lanceolatum TaxID=7740 RepID=A0A8K0E620_BRALA|nr:NDUFAF2 [Branchiostoma lanceolatum]
MFNRIRALIGPAKRFVGADHLGNKYYEIPERTTILGTKRKGRRLAESPTATMDYELGDIPLEWEAWIRGRRKDPPTDTEIEKNEKMMRLKQQRGKEAEEKDMARQQQEYDEGLVARPAPKVHTGHASSPSYEKPDTNQESSTGGTFQPSAWMPGKKS